MYDRGDTYVPHKKVVKRGGSVTYLVAVVSCRRSSQLEDL